MSASNKKKLRKEQNAAQLTEKQLNEQKEAKKLKTYSLTFVAVMALVLVIAIVTASVTAYNNSGIRERNTDALTVGNHTLTNAELNYFYIDVIRETYNNWYSQYGDYTDMYVSWIFGLDVNSPLDQQNYDENQTFNRYFADLAVEDVKTMYAIYDEAIAKGHQRTEEEIADVEETIDSMETYAKLNGTTLKQYLKTVYGNGAQKETFRNYLDLMSVVRSYQTKYHDDLTYDADALKEYNDKHFDEFSSFDYITFFVNSNKFLSGGTKAEDGTTTYSDKEKADALVAAEEAAKELVSSGATTNLALDTAIKELAAYKDDSSAKSTESKNTLYTDISKYLAEWLAADDRKVGDLGYVKHTTTSTDADGNETETVDGYYVVLMQGRNDNEDKLVNVRHILIKPAGGTTDDSGNKTYSDEEWAAAKTKLEGIRDEWLAGEKTAESFGKIADEKTEDEGSKGNGGLYEDVHPGAMVEEFNDWIFDASRKEGDYDIVKTEFGYHLIYFVNTCDETYRNHMIEDTMREEDYKAWFDGLVEAASVTVLDDSLIEHDYILAQG